MKYLHQNDIIHSHLNPRNILIDDDFNPKITDFYFNNKLDIKTIDNEKATFLHYSCQSGNIDLVKYLIYLNKTKIKDKDISDNTILHYVCQNDSIPLFEYISSFKAIDITSRNFQGQTVLHRACQLKTPKIC